MKQSEYKMGIKFDKDPLAVEQNNYLNKIVSIYIVYNLNASPRNPSNNCKFKDCLFGATNIVKISDKEKYMYSGYGITFDSAGFWNFDNDTAKNVIINGIDNSLSSHADNCKTNFLILGEGPIYGINGSFSSPEIKLILILVKQTKYFAWVSIIMQMIVICLLMEKKSLTLRPTIKMLTFQFNFVLEYI